MGSDGQYTQGWLPWQSQKGGTALTRTNDGTYLGMGYAYVVAQNSQPDLADLWLDTGTWKFAYNYETQTSYGIATALLNGASVGTIDQYAGTPVKNVYGEITGIVITTPGINTASLKNVTKNASSSGYTIVGLSVALIRTSGTSSVPGGSDTPGYTWQYLPWWGTKTATGFTTRGQNGGALGGGYLGSSAQNDEFTEDVWLDPGTFKYPQVNYKATSEGIYSVRLDDVEKGTIDGYAASGSFNNYTEVTSITVSTAATRTFKLKMATKNASASGYNGTVQSVAWIRTGA